jgi:ParB-like chromosome segregation protein Spo0J
MIAELPVAQITVGLRHRRDLGDTASLADSIRDLGLLQPIGVDADNRLIFGHRRLEACRSLGWTSIPVRVINAPALLAEHDENEIRKDFNHSERVAIGKEVEAFLGKRQGQRTDIVVTELPVNCPEVKPGQETREVAAKAAGFDSSKTYERAKQVVKKGTPELVQVMDKGDLSISAAATLANLPPQEQKNVVANGAGSHSGTGASGQRSKNRRSRLAGKQDQTRTKGCLACRPRIGNGTGCLGTPRPCTAPT